MLSVFLQRKYNFCHQSTLLDAFRTNSRNVIGRNPSMVIPLLANQDFTSMLITTLEMARKDFNTFPHVLMAKGAVIFNTEYRGRKHFAVVSNLSVLFYWAIKLFCPFMMG